MEGSFIRHSCSPTYMLSLFLQGRKSYLLPLVLPGSDTFYYFFSKLISSASLFFSVSPLPTLSLISGCQYSERSSLKFQGSLGIIFFVINLFYRKNRGVKWTFLYLLNWILSQTHIIRPSASYTHLIFKADLSLLIYILSLKTWKFLGDNTPSWTENKKHYLRMNKTYFYTFPKLGFKDNRPNTDCLNFHMLKFTHDVTLVVLKVLSGASDMGGNM